MNPTLIERHYKIKLDPAYIGDKVGAKLAAMILAAGPEFTNLQNQNGAVQALLATEVDTILPVQVLMSPRYQALANAAYRIQNRWIGGYVRDVRMLALGDSWVARGLSPIMVGTILGHFMYAPAQPGAFDFSTPTLHQTGVARSGNLTWIPSSGCDYYLVWLHADPLPSPWLPVARVKTGTTTYAYSGLAALTKHWCKVYAYRLSTVRNETTDPWDFTTGS
jgi:hypothetical protein